MDVQRFEIYRSDKKRIKIWRKNTGEYITSFYIVMIPNKLKKM